MITPTTLEDITSQTLRRNIETLGEIGRYGDLLEEVAALEGSSGISGLVLLVAEAVNSKYEREALEAFAVACRLLNCASVVLDDLVDADRETSLAGRYGNASALLAGMGTWFIAERKLLEIAALQPATQPAVYLLLDYIHHSLLLIASREYQQLEPQNRYSAEERLENLALVSGLFMEMVCRAAALFAGGDEKAAEKYAAVGSRLGLLHQLKNELESCYDNRPLRNSLLQRQITLPLLYALEGPPTLSAEIRQGWESAEQTADRLLELVEQAGGVVALNLQMHRLYLQLAALLDSASSQDQSILAIARKLLQPDK